MNAGGHRLTDVPGVHVARKEIGIGNPRVSPAEFEMAGVQVAPTCVVLVRAVVLAPDLQRMAASDQREYVRDVVGSLAENGVDVPVASPGAKGRTSLQNGVTRAALRIDGYMRKQVGIRRNVRAVSRQEAK